MIQRIEETHLEIFQTEKRHVAAAEAFKGDVSMAIEKEKQEWIDQQSQDHSQGITSSYKRQPDWKKKERDRLKAGAAFERDIVRDNTLLLVNLGLLYLDFIDACRGDYNGRVEKCIQCFAIVFQGSKQVLYAGECLHIVACLKKVWKPKARYVNCLLPWAPNCGNNILQSRVARPLFDQSLWTAR